MCKKNFKITTKLNGFLEFINFFSKIIFFVLFLSKQLNYFNFYLMFAEEKHRKQLKDYNIVSDDDPGLL